MFVWIYIAGGVRRLDRNWGGDTGIGCQWREWNPLNSDSRKVVGMCETIEYSDVVGCLVFVFFIKKIDNF